MIEDDKNVRQRRYFSSVFARLILFLGIIGPTTIFTSTTAWGEGFPDPPLDVIATAGNASVRISWSPPENNGGSQIIGYTVTDRAGNNEVKCMTADLFCVISGLTNGGNYAFDVTAKNADFRESFPAIVTFMPATTPTPPRDVFAVRGNGSATIYWSNPSNDGGSHVALYEVFINDEETAACGTVGNLCTILELNAGTSYRFAVKAINSVGSSSPSALSNPVTPFRANFESPETLRSYLSTHPQIRQLPANKTLFGIRCNLDTKVLELGTFDTHTVFTRLRNVTGPVPFESCDIHTTYGPSGLYMTNTFFDETTETDMTDLYKVDIATGFATLVQYLDVSPETNSDQTSTLLSISQDQGTGNLNFVFKVAGPDLFSSLPLLYLVVADPPQGGTPLQVVSRSLISSFSSSRNPDNDGNTLVPLFNLEGLMLGDLEEGQSLRVFADLSGSVEDGFIQNPVVIGVVNADGSIVPNTFEINGSNGSTQFVGLQSWEQFFDSSEGPSTFENVFDQLRGFSGTFSSYSQLLNQFFQPIRNLSFNPDDNKLYSVGNFGELFSDNSGYAKMVIIDPLNRTLILSGDFPALSDDFYGSATPSGDSQSLDPFRATTIDENGTLWNIHAGILQTETVAGWSTFGDFQSTGKSNFVDSNSPMEYDYEYIDSIFIAPTLVVSPSRAVRPTVTVSPSNSRIVVGQEIAITATASASDGGVLTYTWSIGEKVIQGATTATYTFTPIISSESGQYVVTVTNTLNATSETATASALVVVSGPLSVSTPTTGLVGTYDTVFSLPLSYGGGESPLTIALTSGTLPAGLALDTSTGLISGTPRSTGTFPLAVTVTDHINQSVTATFQLQINRASQIIGFTLSPDSYATSTTYSSAVTPTLISAGSGNGAVTYSISDGTATGCAISSPSRIETITATSVGKCEIQASKAGDTNYLDATSKATFTFSISSISQSASTPTPTPTPPPPPQAFMTVGTLPTIHKVDSAAKCTAGTFNYGIRYFDGNPDYFQSNSSVSSLTYSFLTNGIVQSALTTVTLSSWVSLPLSNLPSVGLLTCQVTGTRGGVSVSAATTSNESAFNAAVLQQTNAAATAASIYQSALKANLTKEKSALTENRTTWRANVSAAQSNFAQSARKSRDAKAQSAAIRSATEAYKAEARIIANQLLTDNANVLKVHNAAITKAADTYNLALEGAGYGVMLG